LVTANKADAADVDRRVIQARLERAEVLIVDLEGDLKAAQSKLAQVSARADGLEHDRTAAGAIADEAVRAAEAIRQADDRRRARGRWARLRAAWRRE
jgi:hypothetical protein